MEDILTSTVFNILKYLPPEEGLLRLLAMCQFSDGQRFPISGFGESPSIEYLFWPTLQETGDDEGMEFECHPCEPDLFLKISSSDGGRVFVLIEAKLNSPKSSRPDNDTGAPNDQLAKQWDNLVCLSRRCNAKPLLVYLTADFGAPVDQINEARNEYLRKRRSNDFACGWLSWRQIPRIFRDDSDDHLRDLVRLTERLNLRFFGGVPIIAPLIEPIWAFQPAELQFHWCPLSRNLVEWSFGDDETR